jgi:hypothetical protein
MDVEDQLLRSSIDLHAHVYPEFSVKIPGRVHDIEWAELARNAGMRAIVMKSHHFSTVERAFLVQQVVPGIEVYGGLTLNYSIGGLNALAADLAGELGGKIIWMPTWSSKKLAKSQLYINRMKAFLKSLDKAIPDLESGIEILDNGKLKPEVKEIVQVARDHRMIISSGHISIQESLVLVEECTRQNVFFMLAHPLSGSVGASVADQKEVAKRGGYIEHCFITTMPMHQKLDIRRIIEAIEEIGPSQTILTTDAIQTWNPPPPELMRMYIASLLYLGVSVEWIRKMIQENPATMLGLNDEPTKETK